MRPGLREQQVALENLTGLRTSARTLRAGSCWCGAETRWAISCASRLHAIFLRYDSRVFSQQEAFAMVGYMAGLLSPINQLASFNSKLIYNAGARDGLMDVHAFANKLARPPKSSTDREDGTKTSTSTSASTCSRRLR